MNRDARLVAGVVAVHLTLTLAHGWAHASIPVPYADWQGVYAGIVLFLVPVGGVLTVLGGRVRVGYWLVLVAGVGGVAFEGLFHFVVHSPDHVASVEGGAALFATTAVLTTLGDALLVAVAGWRLSWSELSRVAGVTRVARRG